MSSAAVHTATEATHESSVEPDDPSRDALELSIVLPCLDEARTVGKVVARAREALRAERVRGEVVVADNGSLDGSQAIAAAAGARVIHVPERGYGAALRAGIAAARGRFVMMADSDDSYDVGVVAPFLARLRAGDDLVQGNRFAGGIEPGAMPPLHRYFGNPGLTAIGRLLYGTPSGDFYCGQRAFRRDAVLGLELRASGMEFALEMLVRGTLAGLRISEVPVPLRPDGRGRPPHLRTWRDGWRSLCLFVHLSPEWLFLYPGLALTASGALGGALLLAGEAPSAPALAGCAAAVVLGVQLALYALLGKAAAVERGAHPPSPRLERVLRLVRPEHGFPAGAALIALGGALAAYAGASAPGVGAHLAVGGLLAVVVGIQAAGAAAYLRLLQTLGRPGAAGLTPGGRHESARGRGNGR